MMKNTMVTYPLGIYAFILIAGGLFSSCSKMETLPDNASILFEKTEHDFGEIPEKIEARVVFNFENSSKHPLIVKEVKTSCGCAAPSWTEEPIAPSEKGEITVTYDAEYPGKFHKTITVFYNGKDSPQQLIIKGRVPYPKTQE